MRHQRTWMLTMVWFLLLVPASGQQPSPVVVPQAAAAPAVWQQLGRVTAVRKLPHGVEFHAGQAAGRVTVLQDHIVRIRLAPSGRFGPDESWAVLPEAAAAQGSVRFREHRDRIELSTSALTVSIAKPRFRLSILDAGGEIIHQDHPQRPAVFRGQEFKVWKAMPEHEHYYGLGEKGGPLNHRGQAYTMWNTDAYGWQESTDPLYKSIPFFLALRAGQAHGIFLDNTYRTHFNFGRGLLDGYSFGADGGEIDYYFIAGPHPKQVLERYAWLTGSTPLPPRWALGYQQCRYSYFPEARVRELARTFREKRIPVDVIYLDIDYQDGNRPFTVDRKLFPNWEQMIKDLQAQDIKVIAITDLHLKKEEGYRPYDEGMAGDHFVKNPDGSVYVGTVWPGDSVFPDFTREETRRWWGTLYQQFYVEHGINGFWNDMNEPAIFERADKTMPLDTAHRVNGRNTDHREIHNVFGMQNVRATYEGLLRLKPDQRPFVLTRAAYAGTQRYAASWTGDNTSSWNHLRLTVPSLVNLGLSGYPLVGVDIGGFVGSPPADLLTHWTALGAFTPVFRNHTGKGTADQEPWVHGAEHEAIRKHYIEQRYRMLPYLYTAMEETSRTGLPLMRPVFLEFPEDWRFYGNDRQFMFGPDLLVAPRVVETLDEYEVALPKGDWYDYWTGQRIRGKENVAVRPALDALPVFVRAGAIVPHQPVVQHSEEVPEGPLELRVYPGPECRGSLYHDDGSTFAYRRGDFLRVQYTCQEGADSLQVRIAASEGPYQPWWRSVQVLVFGVEGAPQRVELSSGGQAQWRHDPQSHSLTLTLPHRPAGEEIRISY